MNLVDLNNLYICPIRPLSNGPSVPYTDKNTSHNYLPLYDNLLSPIRQSATKVLEVGIGDFGQKNGGSLILWRKYFPNATIYGLDILPITRVLDELISDDKVTSHTEINAYDTEFVKKNFLDKNIKFDFMLDDGPHTLESMKKFIILYSPLLKDEGVLIIEDIKDTKWFNELIKITPENLKPFRKSYDLRKNMMKTDDLVFTIDKIIR